MKKLLLGLLFTSSVYAADMDAVHRFDKQYKLMHSIDEKRIVSTIQMPSGLTIQVIDGGINTDHVYKANSIKTINGKLMLLNTSDELFPTL